MEEILTIGELKRRVSIVEVAREHVVLKKAGKMYRGLSPFADERTPSFYVTDDGMDGVGFFKDFSTGKGGNVFRLFGMLNGLDSENPQDFEEIVYRLSRRAGVTLRGSAAEKRREDIKILSDLCNIFCGNLAGCEDAKDYLRHCREIDERNARKFRLGYADGTEAQKLMKMGYDESCLLAHGIINENGKAFFRDRIMIPIFDEYGSVRGFSGRAVRENEKVKYLHSKNNDFFKKSDFLYGAGPRIREKGFAMIMEGFFDVITSRISGFETGVAPLGTSISEKQAQILAKFTENILICLDGDRAGIEGAKKNALFLIEKGFEVKIATVPHGMDPDEFIREYGKRKFIEVAKSAVDYYDFVMAGLVDEDGRIGELGRRKRAVQRLSRYFEVCGPVDRDWYIKKFAASLEISADDAKRIFPAAFGSGHRDEQCDDFCFFRTDEMQELCDIDTLIMSALERNGLYGKMSVFYREHMEKSALTVAEKQFLAQMCVGDPFMSEQVPLRMKEIWEKSTGNENIEELFQRHESLSAKIYGKGEDLAQENGGLSAADDKKGEEKGPRKR